MPVSIASSGDLSVLITFYMNEHCLSVNQYLLIRTILVFSYYRYVWVVICIFVMNYKINIT